MKAERPTWKDYLLKLLLSTSKDEEEVVPSKKSIFDKGRFSLQE
jgi:hypothetical protein